MGSTKGVDGPVKPGHDGVEESGPASFGISLLAEENGLPRPRNDVFGASMTGAPVLHDCKIFLYRQAMLEAGDVEWRGGFSWQ